MYVWMMGYVDYGRGMGGRGVGREGKEEIERRNCVIVVVLIEKVYP